MPRVSKSKADEHHRAIETAASHLFRERGFAGVSVAELMAQAGLTHGGFYGHFASKDALAAAACTTAFTQSAAKWRARIEAAPTPAAALDAIATAYLDPTSRDRAATACPTAMFAVDVAREEPEHAVRAAFRAGVETQVELLAGLQHTGDAGRDRERACVRLATLVGALLLARATRGHAISDSVLEATRLALVRDDAPIPPAPRGPKPAAVRRARRGLPKGAGA